jgi:short subunit dehydrogenase-like uncharacterized protein
LAAVPRLPRQTGPIAVYGATGYTGRLVCQELARTGVSFVVSGRNPEKLDALVSELGLDAATVPATVDNPGSLMKLMDECPVVIDCAGPFVRYGEPVLAAAIQTGTHYLDTTGEQPYMRMVFERYGPGAARAGVALIPAMGFDFVPGDMIGSLTASGMGELDSISFNYCWEGFTPSQGTARTTLEILSDPGVEWQNLEWRKARGGVSRGTFDFPHPVGERQMIRYPAGEQITVPRHVPTRSVSTAINAGAFSSELMGRAFGAVIPPLGLAMRSRVLRRAIGAVISRLPEGPSAEQREAMRWTIVCEARRGEQLRQGVISGSDVYGLTAAAICRGAILAARRGFEARGALAPSQAFDPEDFLGTLERFDVRWRLHDSLPVAESVEV